MELKNEITKFNLRENGEVDKDDKNGKISEAFKPIAEMILSGYFKVSKNNSASYVTVHPTCVEMYYHEEGEGDDKINVILDGLVPENHLVRKIENAIDFSFIYDKVKDLYSPLGAPSIDPVVLIKIVLIQYLFGIPSIWRWEN